MARTIYGLLVGIDQYEAPINPLHGCINDIEAMQTFLTNRIDQKEYQLDLIVLKNQQAKRKAIIDNFLNHLGKAGPDDTAFFYFCGHGSQTRTAPEFFHIEPDRLDETLVCYDSRSNGNYDLADKEISKLIAEVARKNPHIVVILDSCHSGSGTRNTNNTGVRRIPTDERLRPISSYLITPAELETLDSTRSMSKMKNGWAKLPQGKHIVLSACHPEEEAKEITVEGQNRGVFSYFLMDTLQDATNIWTYRDLFSRINSCVRAKVTGQSPLIEASNFDDLNRLFLGGAIKTHTQYFTVNFDKSFNWIIDAGEVHGIPSVQVDDTTFFELFPIDEVEFQSFEQSIGTAKVLKRYSTYSTLAISLHNGKHPDQTSIYKAILTKLPISPLGVLFQGDEDAIDLVRNALARSQPIDQASFLVQEVTYQEDLNLIAHNNSFFIHRADDDRQLQVVVREWSADSANDAVKHLEHISRWIHLLKLHNPSSRLPHNAITMSLYMIRPDGIETPLDPAKQYNDLILYYEFRNNEWHEPKFNLKLRNNSNRQLYCMLFDLTDRFKIWAEELLPGGGIWLNPDEETWIYNGDPIPASIPDELWEDGMIEYKDYLKIIISTEKCDATKFQQGSLDVKYINSSTRGNPLTNSLEKLLQHAFTREIGSSHKTQGNLIDWTTSELCITTVRPLDKVILPSFDEIIKPAPQVTILGHPKLKAAINLTSIPLARRDMLQEIPLPTWLRDDPSCVQPFELVSSRNIEGGLSVLELTDVTGYKLVTKEEPLTIYIEKKLASSEHILVIAYDPDSNLYLPLGHTQYVDNRIQIRVERLPAPTSSERSLTGSIKIFFQKIFYEKLGLDFEYPLLGITNPDGEKIFDLDEIRTRVSKAERILLYIHGIIGDTHDMSSSAFISQSNDETAPLGSMHDLVLTFDYENLKTPIQENARLLKKRLEQVGLGINHSKKLHIIAHSMGGLVSRWFIEREGGNQIVQHLVMLGTPNKGSPWPTIENWVVGAIGLGLNGLTAVAWPAKVLGSLMMAFDYVAGITLEQMESDSALIKDLLTSPDPGIRYSVIAGNTSLFAEKLRCSDQTKRIINLFEKLNIQEILHKSTSLAFWGNPNDIAVSVESIIGLPSFKMIDPPQEIACDHLSYFTTEAGLGSLSKIFYKEHLNG